MMSTFADRMRAVAVAATAAAPSGCGHEAEPRIADMESWYDATQSNGCMGPRGREQRGSTWRVAGSGSPPLPAFVCSLGDEDPDRGRRPATDRQP